MGVISDLGRDARKHACTAIAAAFAFVMALAWNDALEGVVQKAVVFLGLIGEGYIVKIAAAIIVSIICIGGIVAASKLSRSEVEVTRVERLKDPKQRKR